MTEPKMTGLPSPPEFERLLTRFINGTLLAGKGSVDRDTRLFEDGYMNSLRILDLIAMVEKTLGQRVPDRAVRLANFRTIATIVETFHPDAGKQVSLSADTLFERRGDRSRFKSPLEALEARGDVRVTVPGCVALSGRALDVLEAVDRKVVAWAHSLSAPEHRYPSVIDAGILSRAGQEASTAIAGNAGKTATLAPAVCYHAYPEYAGRTLRTKPALITARGHCYRYEDGRHIPLERLWEFTMREIIVFGTREQVETVRQSLVRQVIAFVEMLELDAEIETATDPFFTTGDEGRRLMQQAGALKYELRLAVDESGRSIAAASFNHHHDFFGTRFDIRDTHGHTAHSGCVAFGLERWVLALFAQHGVDLAAWPNAARTWLADAQPRVHGAGA